MKDRIDWKILWVELAGKIKNFYPYFLVFYIISAILAALSSTWSSFFYWPGLNAAIIIFTVLFILGSSFIQINWRRPIKILAQFLVLFFKKLFLFFSWCRRNWHQPIRALVQILIFLFKKLFLFFDWCRRNWHRPIHGLVKFFVSIYKFLILFFAWCYRKLSPLKKRDWLKIATIILILIFSLTHPISVLEFFLLAYGLISFFFILDSRYAAGLALISLVACVTFLLFKKNILAEAVAVYFFYFLVITVLTQIRELRRDVDNRSETSI